MNHTILAKAESHCHQKSPGRITITRLPAAEVFHVFIHILLLPNVIEMKTISLFSLMLHLFFLKTKAQVSQPSQFLAATTTSSISLTPEMSASAVSSLYSVLATASPQQPGDGELKFK